jgi:hypothetical protein
VATQEAQDREETSVPTSVPEQKSRGSSCRLYKVSGIELVGCDARIPLPMVADDAGRLRVVRLLI